MRRLALFLSLATLSCSQGVPVTSFTIAGSAYVVPDAHVTSLTSEPHQFIRIKVPDQGFDLIHDSRTVGRTDRLGWPILFSLNDDKGPGVNRHQAGDLRVVCRKASNPRGGCGLAVSHGRADWAVMFPEAQLPHAAAIRERAIAALNTYQR